jgi:hypothetical protein
MIFESDVSGKIIALIGPGLLNILIGIGRRITISGV